MNIIKHKAYFFIEVPVLGDGEEGGSPDGAAGGVGDGAMSGYRSSLRILYYFA